MRQPCMASDSDALMNALSFPRSSRFGLPPPCRGSTTSRHFLEYRGSKFKMHLLVEEVDAWWDPRPIETSDIHGNEPAVRLYESFGFSSWGVEPLAIRTPSGYKGKVHMALQLSMPTTSA